MAACNGFTRVARGWRMPRFGGRGMRRVYGKVPCKNKAVADGVCRAHRSKAAAVPA